jgi:hypothetical protein
VRGWGSRRYRRKMYGKDLASVAQRGFYDPSMQVSGKTEGGIPQAVATEEKPFSSLRSFSS